MGRLRQATGATAVDVAVVVFIAAVTEWAVFETHEHISTPIAGPRWLTVTLPLLIALPLLWRRRKPLLVTALVMAGFAIQAIVSGHTPEGFQLILVWMIVPYSVAAYSDRRDALVGFAIVLLGFAVYAVQNDDIVSGRAGDLWSGAFFLLLAVGAWLAGMVVHGRREAAALTAQASALEREAQQASAEERARMARELHDIVSHNLSVVVVQAAGARARAEQQNPESTALEKIERSGREALVEMRRLLGVLREDESGPNGLSPQPGIAQLEDLAEGVRASGVQVDLAVEGDCSGLPPAIDLSAYRIVQEALTNTLKHAGGEAKARVQVSRDGDALTVDVADDGVGPAADSATSTGHGLVGMRERAALLGGDLRAGARPGGGFAVSARLPLSAGRP
ncbi:MAG TPA: sensor histidine kinase [Thermoleophilaceae bacterium]|jgi:signal transduction histidine kinase